MATGTVSSISADNWQLISSATPTSGANVSFTSITGYKTLMVAFKNVTSVSNAAPMIRVNSVSTAGVYADVYGNSTAFYLAYSTTGAKAGAIIIYDADKAVPHYVLKSSYDATVPDPNAWFTDPVAVTQLDLTANTGVGFSGGTVYLYGIAS